MKEECL